MTVLTIAELGLGLWAALLIGAAGFYLWEPLDARRPADWAWGAAVTAALVFALWTILHRALSILPVLTGGGV